jgi:hypothetical protein
MTDRIDDLEQAIRTIEERNKRVEADKAWETSFFRISSIAIFTYTVALVALWSFGASQPFLSALIPAFGFILSVQSLPFLKRWWIRKCFRLK